MNSLRRTPTCRRRCACARRPRLAHVGHVPRASVFDLPVPSGDRGTGIMSHPQKTCRVLSPSARVGLRPFGAIMPRYALLVAGEPPQQGVNVRSPPASPLASANAALPTSAQTRLCVGACRTGRAPALAPTTVPIRLGNPFPANPAAFASAATSSRRRHPRSHMAATRAALAVAALPAPTTSATRTPHLRARTNPAQSLNPAPQRMSPGTMARQRRRP